MQKAASAAGQLTRESTPEQRMNISNHDDMVTMIDLDADNLIREIILQDFPDIVIVSEEAAKLDNDYHPDELHNFTGILLDSIDGSVNFSRMVTDKYGNFAVSIGYCVNGKPIIGVIYKPLEDEMFHAVKNMGAFLNDKPINVSDVSLMNQSSIEIGSFWIRTEMDLFNRWFKNKETDVNQILVRGSAAVALADIARGRTEAMLHSRLNAWDYAAGWIIIEEAGGIVMDGDTSPLTLGSRYIYATNKYLNDQIVQIIKG